MYILIRHYTIQDFIAHVPMLPAHAVSRQVFAIVLTGALPGVYSRLVS